MAWEEVSGIARGGRWLSRVSSGLIEWRLFQRPNLAVAVAVLAPFGMMKVPCDTAAQPSSRTAGRGGPSGTTVPACAGPILARSKGVSQWVESTGRWDASSLADRLAGDRGLLPGSKRPKVQSAI
jgi:hypothetical protein